MSCNTTFQNGAKPWGRITLDNLTFDKSRGNGSIRLIRHAVAMGVTFAVLTVMLLGFVGFRQQCQTGACQSNLDQIGKALALYIQDNDGLLPRLSESSPWPAIVTSRHFHPVVLGCPSVSSVEELPGYGEADYALNAYLAGSKSSLISQPDQVVLGCDYWRAFNPWITCLPSDSSASRRHRVRGDGFLPDHANYLFVDGHCAALSPLEVSSQPRKRARFRFAP